MKNLKALTLLNLLGLIATLLVNSLANILPINGFNTGELSDRYPNLFVPAGITFSIWAVIYLLLIVFCVYQLALAFGKAAAPKTEFISKISFLFLATCVINCSWILAWHYLLLPLSLLLMLSLLGGLIAIYLRLDIGKSQASNSEKYLVHLPFSIYLGWITIATIANTTALLVNYNWGGFGVSEALWTIIVIVVGLAIALAVLFTRNDIFFPAVSIWALLGIIIKRQATMPVESQIITTAYIAIALLSVGILVQIFRGKVYKI